MYFHNHTEPKSTWLHVERVKKRVLIRLIDDEMKPEPKKQQPKNTVLWCPLNRHTHIKRENKTCSSFSKECSGVCLRKSPQPACNPKQTQTQKSICMPNLLGDDEQGALCVL
jgi:hypothetical protein